MLFKWLGRLVSLTIILLSPLNAQPHSIENFFFSPLQNSIEINFDLIADQNVEFDISLELRRISDQEFLVIPKSIFGENESLKSGKNKKIIWNINDDLNSKLEGEDYYFVLIVEEASKGIAWYIFTGGAAVIGGIIYLIIGNGDDNDNPTNPTTGIADPPARP